MSGDAHVQTDMEPMPTSTRTNTMTSQENSEHCRMMYDDLMSKVCRDWLRDAIFRRDKGAIERGLKDLQAKTPRDGDKDEDPEIAFAQKMIKVLTVGENLKTAILEKDLAGIKRSLVEIRQKRMYPYLQNEAMEGERALELLLRRQGEKQNPLDLNRNTLSELRRYSKPPEVVHKVMIASLLLLGEDEHTTQDWKDCQKICNPYNRNSLVQRVAEFDVNLLHPEIAARSRQILDEMNFDMVHAVSSGAATFYVWARVVLEDMPASEGAPPANVDRQRQILGKPCIPGARASPILARRKNKFSQTMRGDWDFRK